MTYDTTKVTDDLTYDKLLSKLNPYHIYAHYIGKEVKLNRPISSPLREDKTPSWTLFKGRSGDIMWKDFSTGESGGVVHLVKKMYDLTYHKALEKIWFDMVNGKVIKQNNTQTIERISKPRTEIAIKRKYFTQTDNDYWCQYRIKRETLKFFNVFPIETFWSDGIQSKLAYSKSSPMYAYKIFDKFKIYRPYSTTKKDKWRNNCGSYDLQGLEQLPETGDLLIITKSLKDVMVLYEHGYISVAPQSETASIPTRLMNHLKQRFKKIIVFFDYDNGGMKGAKMLCEKHSLEKTFIPKHYLEIYGIKDISDFAKEMSEQKTIDLLKELFDEEKN